MEQYYEEWEEENLNKEQHKRIHIRQTFNSPFGQKRQGNIAGLIAGPFHGLVTKAEKHLSFNGSESKMQLHTHDHILRTLKFILSFW